MAWWDDILAWVRGSSDAPQVGPHAPKRRFLPGMSPSTPGSTPGLDTLHVVDEELRLEHTRLGYYSDFDQMDRECPEAHRALDVFADNATQPDHDGNVVVFDFKVAGVEDVVDQLNRDTRLLERMWGHMRAIRKSGDHFAELVFDVDGRLARVKDLPVREIRRVEDEWGLPDEYPFRQVGNQGRGSEIAAFREWQVVHWGDVPPDNRYAYERSQLASARRPWKAVELAQNSLLAERVLHTGTRIAHTIDVSGLSADEAIEYLRAVKREYQQSVSHNVSTGKRSNSFAPLTQIDDIWIPWQADGPSDPVKVLKFGGDIGEIADVKFIYSRFLAALDVPRFELGLDEDIRSKAATNVIETGFLRRVMRAQATYLRGYVQIVNTALFVSGFRRALDGDFRELWSVKFAPLHLIDEKIRAEIAKLRSETASLWHGFGDVSTEFLLREFGGFTDEEIKTALLVFPDERPGTTDTEARKHLDSVPAFRRLVALVGRAEAMRMYRELEDLFDLRKNPPSSDDLPPNRPAELPG